MCTRHDCIHYFLKSQHVCMSVVALWFNVTDSKTVRMCAKVLLVSLRQHTIVCSVLVVLVM